MKIIESKEQFRNLFYYDRKGQMYVFVITESIIITEEIMNSLPLETLINIYNDELDLIRKKMMEKAEEARLN